MSKGTADKVEGRLKEAGGALLDDDELKNEGRADQIVGDIKDALEDAGDTASDLVEKAADLLKGK
jgi:uncharacterized protein YjbJ (UPF0337 family)